MDERTSERLRRLSRAARESAKVAEDDRQARNRAFVEADDAGHLLREIAREAEMSVAHVQRIIVDETARRQAAAG